MSKELTLEQVEEEIAEISGWVAEEAKADAEWIKTGVWDELDLLDRDHVEPTPEPELEEWEVYEAMAEAEGY